MLFLGGGRGGSGGGGGWLGGGQLLNLKNVGPATAICTFHTSHEVEPAGWVRFSQAACRLELLWVGSWQDGWEACQPPLRLHSLLKAACCSSVSQIRGTEATVTRCCSLRANSAAAFALDVNKRQIGTSTSSVSGFTSCPAVTLPKGQCGGGGGGAGGW